MVALRTGRGVAKPAVTGPNLRDIGRADAKAGRHLHKRQVRTGQHPVPQILPVSLSHDVIPSMPPTSPETVESHMPPISEAP